MKNIRNVIVVAFVLVAAAVALAVTFNGSGNKDILPTEEITVSVAPVRGITVTSQNPVKAKPGDKVTFNVSEEQGYVLRSFSKGEYSGGVLTLETDISSTVYPVLSKYCTVTAAGSKGGTAEVLTPMPVLDGDSVNVKILPDENYQAVEIDVDGMKYPVPSQDVFTFPAPGDCTVSVRFEGRSVNLMVVSSSIGSVEVSGGTGDYHYGDEVRLTAKSAESTVSFTGWSQNDFIDEGGTLISEEPSYTITITDDTVLYANFKDSREFILHYNANGGSIEGIEDETHYPHEYVNLVVDTGAILREGYTLVGYNTEADGSGA